MRTPYSEIADLIEKWCEEHYYTDFLVTISINGEPVTEVLEFDGNNVSFVWLHDWWEGEKDVHMLGFYPIGDIKLAGLPAVDVRPVVLCRDCKNWFMTPNGRKCYYAEWSIEDDDFCSCGEKREEG
jgi:hypothetical protein